MSQSDREFSGGGPAATWFLGAMPILARARRFSDTGRHDLAADELRRGLTDHPESDMLHAQLANELHSLKNFDQSADEARAALALNPGNILAKIVLAHVSMDRGQHRQAEQLLLETLHEDPNNPPLLMMYATLIFRVGQTEKGVRLLEAVLELDPENETAHSMLAAYHADKDSKRAALHAGEGLRLAPDSDFSHVAAGLTALQRGRPWLARRYFREALRIDPSDPQAESLFLSADRCTRPTYLPMYYLSVLSRSVPGGTIGIWIGLLLAAQILRVSPTMSPYYPNVMFGIFVFAVYTWVADPITGLWIKIFPPRLHE